VSETGLLIAQAAFIVLLYGFIWLVVRSSSKQVGASMPPPPPPVVEPERRREALPSDLGMDMPEVEPDLLEAHGPIAPEPEIATAAAIAEAPAPNGEPAQEEDEIDGAPGAFSLTDASRPRLVVHSSPSLAPGTEFPLSGGMTIGRSPSSGVEIDDDFVSHMHARVMRRGEFYFISDLGSTNGTSINGRAIDAERQLRVRDEIQVGETVLRYEE
jgi:hypothetical protein